MGLDQVRDTLGVELYRLASLHDLPPYVKAASEVDIRGTDDLPAHGFAEPGGRLYPVHTPAATWVSSAYFASKRAEVDPAIAVDVDGRLRAAASYWGIAGDVDATTAAIAKAAAFDDASVPDDCYAVVERFEGGRVERHMRLLNEAEVKVAAAYLGEHRDLFAYDDRRTVARKILQRADAVKAAMAPDVADMLDRVAGFGTCAASHAVDLLRKRAAAATERDRDAYERLAELCGHVEGLGGEVRDPATLHKLATFVDRLDRELGLARRYGGDFERPEDVLFRVTEKAAAGHAASRVTTSTGSVYLRDDLSMVPIESVRDHMGGEFAGAIGDGRWVDAGKAAAVLPTMPRDDAGAFDRMADALGIGRAAKSASCEAAGPALAAIAAALS